MRKILSIGGAVILTILFLAACSEEVGQTRPHEASLESASEEQKTTTIDVNSPGNGSEYEPSASYRTSLENRAENDVTQPSDMQIENIALYAHRRDGNEPLYPIREKIKLKLGSAKYKFFTEAEKEQIIQLLAKGDYQADPENPSIVNSENGDIFIDGGTFQFSSNRYLGGETGGGYAETLGILNSSYILFRRVLTASQSEELPFLSRAEARSQAENLFASLGISDIILRAHYSVYEKDSGRPFYYLQFMQELDGVPLADEFGLPYFPELDAGGVFNSLECVIDAEGLAYLSSVFNYELFAKDEEVMLLSKDEVSQSVDQRLSDTIGSENKRTIDSIELFWGSDRGAMGMQDGEEFNLVPYYLLVIRSSGSDHLGAEHGDMFERWIFDAVTGEQQ